MPAAAAPSIAAQPGRSSGLLRCYALEAKHEFLRLLRTPMFCLPTLVFPASFYLMFSLALSRGGASGAMADPSLHLLASYGVFGVMAPGLFGFGVSVAVDRDRGWLRLRRALPMPPGSYLVAKLAMAMLFAAMVAAILAIIAIAPNGVRLPPSAWAALLAVEVFGVLPFCAIGLWIGSLANGQAAPAIVNLVYLPMSFLSGLWMPLSMLPAVLRDAAPLWPSWHLAQLAHTSVGRAAVGSPLAHVAVLAGVTLGFLALARRRLVRG